MFFKPLGKLVIDDVFNHRTDFGRDQFVLGLGREFGIRNLDRNHARQTFTGIITGKGDLFLFGDAAFLGVVVDLTGQSGTETGHVRPAITLRNIVGKAQRGFVVAVVPLQGDFDGDAVFFAFDANGFFDLTRLVAVKIFDKGANTAFVMQFHFGRFATAFITQRQDHARVQEGQFTQAVFQCWQVEIGHREDFGIRVEGHFGP